MRGDKGQWCRWASDTRRWWGKGKALEGRTPIAAISGVDCIQGSLCAVYAGRSGNNIHRLLFNRFTHSVYTVCGLIYF